jgi:hypothetical protein
LFSCRFRHLREGASVPVGRYFLYVGGVLVALLFVVGWYLPGPTPMASFGGRIDSATLRVRSEHKWPERMQFDTAAPSRLPPSPPSVAETASEDPKLEAHAEIRSPEKPAVAKPKPRVQASRRHRQPQGQPQDGVRFAVNPSPQWGLGSSWSW